MTVDVTIGIPAYRNETTIERTIESILSQKYTRWHLIISDDGSPDRTADICKRYARKHENITFIQQPENLYWMNFRYLLERANTRYFVWLAGDDYWSPDFLNECVTFLDNNPDYVCCITRTLFTRADGSTFQSRGTRPLDRDNISNMADYLCHPIDGCRIYGVLRTDGVIDCFPDTIMHAFDWAFCASTLGLGKHHEISGVHLFREKTVPSEYNRSIQRDERFSIYRIFPVLHMSLHLLLKKKIPPSWRLLLALVSLNLQKHEEQVRIMHPEYYNRIRFLYRWILQPLAVSICTPIATKPRARGSRTASEPT